MNPTPDLVTLGALPDEQPQPAAIITWFMRYTPGGTIYQYAAVRVEGHGWYTTSTKWPAPLGWADLAVIIGTSPCAVAVPAVPAAAVSRVRPPEPDYTAALEASIAQAQGYGRMQAPEHMRLDREDAEAGADTCAECIRRGELCDACGAADDATWD